MLKKILSEPVTIYRYDKFITGFIPGIVAPWLGVVLFYVAKFSYMPFTNYMKFVFMPPIFSPMLSLGVVMNLFVFFLFISRNYYVAARAVMLASILYAIPILVVKFL
ncbi:MAG: hypothetical protein KF872_12405 [Chitinophagales bacterium]|nr:hypothetical protein [Chitinophagales bacterium]